MTRHVDIFKDIKDPEIQISQVDDVNLLTRHTLGTEASSPFLKVFREDLPPVSTNRHSDGKPAIPRSKAICCAEWRTASETFDRCWGCRSKYLERSQLKGWHLNNHSWPLGTYTVTFFSLSAALAV
ncbi:hypothetical protein E2320_002896 [Naja naja]|nr:hypothetical protein E2320_002896 [Naja naja]